MSRYHHLLHLLVHLSTLSLLRPLPLFNETYLYPLPLPLSQLEHHQSLRGVRSNHAWNNNRPSKNMGSFTKPPSSRWGWESLVYSSRALWARWHGGESLLDLLHRLLLRNLIEAEARCRFVVLSFRSFFVLWSACCSECLYYLASYTRSYPQK